MIRPKPLEAGAKVAVIAPASPIKGSVKNVLKEATSKIKQLGFEPVIYPSCYEVHGYLSGNDQIRVNDLNNAFKNEGVDGIVCLRGGYGTPRLLNLIDYDAIKENPKVFLGYSDITALHVAFNQKCELITYHGPMAQGLIDDTFTLNSVFQNLTGAYRKKPITNPEGIAMNTLSQGKAEGMLIGGNLSLLVSTLGSPYEIDTKGKILFIEEIDEEIYRIDRMLMSLSLAGKFEDAKAIVFGGFTNCEATDRGLSLKEAIEEVVLPFGKPVVSGLQSGHVYPQVTLAMGESVTLEAREDGWVLQYSEKG